MLLASALKSSHIFDHFLFLTFVTNSDAHSHKKKSFQIDTYESNSQSSSLFGHFTTLALPFGHLRSKYARILCFQFVFTKYVIGFRNYKGFIFVVFDVIFQNVIMCKYDKIQF